MHLETDHGISTAEVSTEEALATDWSEHHQDIDIVRVVEPAADTELSLVEAGFIAKPDRLIWLAPAGSSEEEFLSRLSQNSRYLFRKSVRRTENDGVRITVQNPLTPETLDPFLDVYKSRVSEMRNGLMLAPLERDDFLAQRGEYLTVNALQGGVVVGGCICHHSTTDSLLRLRYVAVAPERHSDSLTRSIYAMVFRVARELGCRNVSLGVDINLYGHIVRTGLFRFKAQLGFTPMPFQQFTAGAGRDVAERVLRLENLSDPSFVLGYKPAQPGEALDRSTLRGEVLASDEAVDLRPFGAGFLEDLRLTVIKPV